MTDLKDRLGSRSLTLQWDVARGDSFNGLLSTATLTRFMLDTSWRLVSEALHDGVTSVTAMVQVSHEQPTPAGEIVTVEARVTEVADNVVRIALKAVDETGVIAHGFNERHVVSMTDLERLTDARASVLKGRL